MMRFDFLDTGIPAAPSQITAEGWIRADAVLSRCGIFEYRQPDGAVRREFRPPAEVFHRDSLGSLRGVPVTNLHVPRADAANPASIIGTVLTEGRQDGDNIRGEIVIHNPKAIGQNRHISLAYAVRLDETPGTWKGQRYDAIQRRVIYNHCAIVPSGRAGNAILRLDAGDAVMVGDGAAPLPVLVQGRPFYSTPAYLAGAAQAAHHSRAAAQMRADGPSPIQSADQARRRMLNREAFRR